MPRLLLLCEYPTLNGGEQSMLSTLGGVLAAGLTPLVAAPADGPLAEALTQLGVEVLPLAICDAAGRRLPQAAAREELARLLRQVRPDLLHANSLAMGRLSGPVARESTVRSLTHLRDIVRLSPQAVADVNCHTRLLAVSHATRDFHVAYGLAADKTQVLYNGVDLLKFQPAAACGYLHRELALATEVALVGTIGQISLRKGQDVLLRAAARLAGAFPQVHYVIVGSRFSTKAESRGFEADLHAVAGEELRGRLHFLGVRDDVPALLHELTLLAHPARQEPLGRVLLEAAAAGVPVVASDVGGTAEIFPPDTKAAQLVPVGDDDALARALAELLSDAALRRGLATAARQRAETAFDVRVAVAGLLGHYQELLG